MDAHMLTSNKILDKSKGKKKAEGILIYWTKNKSEPVFYSFMKRSIQKMTKCMNYSSLIEQLKGYLQLNTFISVLNKGSRL